MKPMVYSDCKRIVIDFGPEDMALNSRSKEIFISSHARHSWETPGNIYVLNPVSHKIRLINRRDEPENFILRPHGISFVSSRQLLYVVNHGKTEKDGHHAIVLYKFKKNVLYFVQVLEDPLLASPNDVAALPNGDLYVTNDRVGSSNVLSMLFKRANVVHYNSSTKKWNRIIKGLSFANGILVTSNMILVADTNASKLLYYNKQDDSQWVLKKRFPVIHPDNITFYSDNEVIVASHKSLFAFIRHASNMQKKSPGALYLVNLDTSSKKLLYEDVGEGINAMSTGLFHRNQIFIGQVFDKFILSCPVT